MASIAKFDVWQNTAGVNYQTVLQVVQRIGTAPYALAVTANTWATYPSSEMSLSITPRFNTSKILLMASITLGSSVNQSAYRFTRGGVAIGVGDVSGSRPRTSAQTGHLYSTDLNHTFRTISQNFLDSPATTSATTYNIDVMSEGTTCYLNRSPTYTDSTPVYCGTAISTFIALEISQ